MLVDTTKRIFGEYELKGCIAANKPASTKKYLKARLRWSKRYELLDADAWNKIIFRDESRIKLHSNERVSVRRPPRKQNDPRYTTKILKFGGKDLILKGYLKSDSSRKLVKIYDKLNISGFSCRLKLTGCEKVNTRSSLSLSLYIYIYTALLAIIWTIFDWSNGF